MTNFLSNAFSLQMLQGDAKVNIAEIQKSEIPFSNIVSTIGHQDIAHRLGVCLNRVDTKLKQGDTLYVAQYCGGRLKEGCTTIPDDAPLKFFKVTVTYK